MSRPAPARTLPPCSFNCRAEAGSKPACTVSNFSNYAKHNMAAADNEWGSTFFSQRQCWISRINSAEAGKREKKHCKSDKTERQVTAAGKAVKKQN